jgi:hypothetical protein
LIIPAEVDTYVAFLENQRHLVKLVCVAEDYEVMVKNLKRHTTEGRGKIIGCIVWAMKSVKW